MAKRKTPAAAKAADAQPALDEIVWLIKAFCRGHLNEEYAVLCCRLAEKLARKRPSPLLSGMPNVWSSGIVRVIGWVNFLDDKTQKPHLKLTAIDKAFGVGESTGQGKAKLIRGLFKIIQFDPTWTLPSLIDDNPLVWMVDYNGFSIDARSLPRPIQEEAFRLGLIPYLPE